MALVVALRAVGGPEASDADVLVRRAAVPSRLLRQGEVRLVQRGDTVVVQTVLLTRYLGRVTHAIREKELQNWPEGAPGAADAAHYRDALARAAAMVSSGEGAEDGHERSRRHRLAIEFICGADTGTVRFLQPEVGEDADGLAMLGAKPLFDLEVSRTYVARNQELIVADSLGAEGVAALARLRSAPAR